MNRTCTRRYVKGLLVVWILTSTKNFVYTDPGRDFLTTVITRLKEERPVENHHLFYNELLKATSRSADEYQIQENQRDSEENTQLHPAQSNELFNDFNQNAFQHLNSWQNAANPLAVGGGSSNVPLVNFPSILPADLNQGLPISTSFQEFQVGLKPFELNNYLNLPAAQQLQQQPLFESTLDSTTEENRPQLNLQDDRGPNLFSPTPLPHQHPVNPAFNFQTANHVDGAQHQLTLPNLLNNGLTNGLLKPAYNYFNADHSVDDNLIDDTINAMRPYTGGVDHGIDGGPSKQFMVEPLFVAMAGFVGVAMIFMSAVLFLPKLLTPPPEVSSLKGPQELAALTKLAVQTIEGNDCTERIACEVGRAMRGLNVNERPIELLEVLVSKNIANQLAQIRKAIANKQICRLIKCKPLKSAGNFGANQKSKSAIEQQLSKIAWEPQPSMKVKQSTPAPKNKSKQQPAEPRVEPTTKHSVVKKTLDYKANTTKRTTTKS